MDGYNIRVLCVGAATQDIFLAGRTLKAKRDVRSEAWVEQFPLGSKIDLDNVYFETGGGATNAAVTFSRQGFKASFMGKIGSDPAGNETLRVLKKEAVSTDLVAYDENLHTGYSTILLAPSGERAILSYRGASHNLHARDFNIKNLHSDWFYITSLAGNMDLLKRLINHAHDAGIRVALNPGQAEIKQARRLKKLLSKVEVLICNQDELAQLFGGDSPKETIAGAFGVCPYVVMTDGAKGSYATWGDKIYFAGQYQKVKVIDRTGAGDAFGSGFVAALAKGYGPDQALTLGSANSTAVVQKVGAKSGILKTDRLKTMKIKTVAL